MSALGQKQTFALQKGMSALPSKADIDRRGFCAVTARLQSAVSHVVHWNTLRYTGMCTWENIQIDEKHALTRLLISRSAMETNSPNVANGRLVAGWSGGSKPSAGTTPLTTEDWVRYRRKSQSMSALGHCGHSAAHSQCPFYPRDWRRWFRQARC
jgi:hypothetical protein